MMSVPVVLLVAVIGFVVMRPLVGRQARPIPLSELAQRVRSGDIVDLRVMEKGGEATTRSGEVLSFYSGDASPLISLARFGATQDELVRVSYNVVAPSRDLVGVAVTVLPLVLFGGILVFAWRRMSRNASGGNSMLSFGQSRARTVLQHESAITFADVAGVDEPRQELQEIVEFLTASQIHRAWRAHSARCAAGRPARYRQDVARSCSGRRSESPVL
jgi:cell division protease FtsH